MIQFENVFKHYDTGREALHNINFTIDRGEMAFITGHSGAGKSTLLKLIMLMEKASRGRIFVAGENLADLTPRQIPYKRRLIGTIFQDHRLINSRTIFDNVALPLMISGYKPYEMKRRVRAALDKVGLLSKENFLPNMLSGGEQQRVGIARAVVNKPQILLADEPTGNLDPALSLEIMKLFKQFNLVGTTVLIATHNLQLVNAFKNTIITLDNGRLVTHTCAQQEAAVHG